MQTVSELYREIVRHDAYRVVTMAEIDGIEYGEHGIEIFDKGGLISARVSGGLFAENKPCIGSCVSRQVDIVVQIPAEFEITISRMAKIRLYSRVRLGEQESEWIPKGVFYIDTRRPDEASGTLTIHGYDAILLHGGETYLAEGDVGAWPRSADVVVNDLADRFGLELDERTVIDPSVLVPFPNDWTCRELLGFIGAAHAGNWTVTDVGKLRLVPLWSVPEETHYLVDQNGDPITFGGHRILLTSNVNQGPTDSGAGQVKLDRNMEQYGAPPAFEPFSRVTMWYDDENAFTAGDDTGRTLEVDCPIASQAIAEKVLAAIRGYAYQPYEAAGAILDPAAELGDGVSANGVYSVLASCTTIFDALMVSDIAAPADEEIDHEMPYETQVQRTLKRKLTLGKMYNNISITGARGLEAFVEENGNKVRTTHIGNGLLTLYSMLGVKRVYLDPTSGEYVFVGNFNIRGGKMNINDKFVVDEEGNATLTDAWLKAAVLYAGNDSQYYARMLGDAFALMNKDSDVPRAALQADRSMVELILGAGSDEEGVNGRLYVQKGVEGGANVARVRYIDANGRYSTVEFDDTNGITVESEAGVKFIGNVDFSGATVTGLTPSG